MNIVYFDRYKYNSVEDCYEFYLHQESKPRVNLPRDPQRGFKPAIHSLIQLLSELEHEEAS